MSEPHCLLTKRLYLKHTERGRQESNERNYRDLHLFRLWSISLNEPLDGAMGL